MTYQVPTLSIRKSNDDSQIGIVYNYFNDTIERYLEGKVSVFTFSVLDKNNHRELLQEGNSISFTYHGEDYHLTIVKKDEDEDVITITAWSLVLELNNETKAAYEGKNLTFAQYLDAFDGENILTLNINEVSDKKISNKWESQQSMLERLFSLATVFSAELEFNTILANDGSLKELQVNVYKKHDTSNQGLGEDRSHEVFYFGDTIRTVKKSTSIMNLFTAIRPVGKDGLTLNNYTMADIKDDNGDVLYTCKNGMIYAPQSREQFPSNLINKADKWTVYDWQTDYTTQASLAGNALAKLKTLSVPETTWTIEGNVEGKIGDTIAIQDTGYTPTLLLVARINTQKICMTNPSASETTFTNVEQEASQLSSELITQMQKLIAEKVPYIPSISTTNGITFKNGVGETTLASRVLKNGVDVTADLTIRWYRDKAWLATQKSITIEASSIPSTALYSFTALDTYGNTVATDEVTLSNVYDGVDGKDGADGVDGVDGAKGDQGIQGPKGEDGKSSYTHLAYADSADGKTNFSVSNADRKYIGMYVDTTSTDSTNPTDYKWTLVKGADGSQGIAGKAGADGRTPYLHIAYADSSDGTTNFSTTEATNRSYLGTYTDFTSADSSDPTKYTWVQVKGERGPQGLQGLQGVKGDQGIQGPKGATGSSSYTHIAYANNSTGTSGFSLSDSSNKTYIGMYVDSIATDSTTASNYKWSLIKGADGNQGIQGPKGADGQTPYLHTAYATSADGSTGFSTTVSSGKTYIGLYTDYTATDSTDPTKYKWTLVKGDTGPQGLQGLQGAKGDQGIQGPKGNDGASSYAHITYATSADGRTNFSVSDSTNKTYIGMYVDNTATDSTDPTKYNWTLIKGADGAQGIQGKAGADGKTPYLHIAYATNSSGTSGFSTTDSSGKTYIGTYTDYTASDSTDATKYRWVLIKGEQGPQGLQGLQGIKGDQGIQGPKGATGSSSYTHIAYATSADGMTNFSVSDSTNKTYIGMYVDSVATDSTTASNYKWSLIKGADGSQGIQGPKGADGRTPYLHIAYATNSSGTTGFSTTDSNGKTYIGTYTDYTASDSTDPTKYLWSLMKGDKGDKGDTGPQGLQGIQGLQGAKGDQGIQGPKGNDGLTSYTHIAYATNSTGSEGFSVSDPTNKTYIGIYVDNTSTDSSTPSKYKWTLIKGATGPKGDQGIQGQAGADGRTPYFHTAWAMSSDGRTGFSVSVSAGKYYIGTYTDYTATDSTDPTRYNWVELANAIGMHFAYAWSADGTDRFTKDYPNENLLTYSNLLLRHREWTFSPDTGVYSINQTNSGTTSTWLESQIPIISQTDTITISYESVTIGSASKDAGYFIAVGGWDSNWVRVKDGNIALSEFKLVNGRYSRTISISESRTQTFYGIQFKTSVSAGGTANISFKNIKVEDGSGTTLFTTNPQDDYDNAVPRYVGRSLKDSSSASDYAWEVNSDRRPWVGYMKELDGTGFSKIPYGKNLVLSSSSPFVMTGNNSSNQTQTMYLFEDNKKLLDIVNVGAPVAKVSYDFEITGSNRTGTFHEQGNNTPWVAFSNINMTKSKGHVENILAYSPSWTGALMSGFSMRMDNSSGTLKVTNFKLELGSVATPWTPNPNDADADGSNASALLQSIPKYIGYSALPSDNWGDYTWQMNPVWADANASNGLNTKVDSGEYGTTKDDIYEQIANRVTQDEADEIRAIAQKVLDSYNAYVDPDAGKAVKDLKALEDRLTGLVNNLGSKVAQWNFIDTWMRVGEEGLEMANNKSTTKILVKNDRISFIDSGTEVAYFSGQNFEIKRGVITQSIILGSHKFDSLSKEHTVLRWVK